MANKGFYLAILALALLCLGLGVKGCSEHDRAGQYKQAFEALNDTVHTYRNKQGQFVASIAVLKVERSALLAVDAGKDKQLAQLKAVVAADKHVTGAAVFTAKASGKASGASTVLTVRPAEMPVSSADTTRAACPPCEQPVYQSTVSGDGLTATIVAGPDSTQVVSYTIEQDYAVTFTSKSVGLLKPRVATVEITALSPGGRVMAVRSFEQPKDKPRRGAWFAGGAGAALLLVLLL